MADSAEQQQQQQQQQPDLVTGSPPQKRKRGTESASPDARRSKRGASVSGPSTGGVVSGLEHQVATAFMEPSGAGGGGQPDGLTSAEFGVGAGTGTDHADALASTASTAAAALGMYPTMQVPQSTEETFASQHVGDGSGVGGPDTSPYNTADVSGVGQAEGLQALGGAGDSNGVAKRPISGIQVKPAVGTDEWHKMRKDNHKEVERRRRETINEGINELAKIVPGCEKNKGSILQRAVVFITQLKENETQNIEKWTLEKLLTEQAIAELSASNDKLKVEVERLYRELETWKRVAQNAGLQPPEEKAEQPS